MNRECCCTNYKTWYKKTYKPCKDQCPDQKYFIAFACHPSRCTNGKVFRYEKYKRSGNACQCQGKHISCNNVNVPLNPKKPCLQGTIRVIYPIINQNMYC